MDMFRSYLLTVLCLTETWHDADSPVFGRCRASGFPVVDRPRPRVRDDLSVNHGGVAILAAPGTSLSRFSINSSPSTFEVVACHVTTGRHRAAVAVVYRPGSQPVTAQFFEDLTALLEQLVVLRVPLFVTGDFNVRLNRDDCHAQQLRSLFEAFGLKIGLSGPTHRDGGILDLVAACIDVPVSVVNVERSDHSLLHWPVTSDQATIPSVTVRARSWRRLDDELFRSKLASSDLCLPSSWPADVDAAATLYNDVIVRILDEILPARDVVRRPRPSDPWFDAECRAAKRLTRRLERASLSASRRAADAAGGPTAAATTASAASARELWQAQRRTYRQLRQQKCVSFWSEKFTTAANPRDMWSTVNRLLGRGSRACDGVSAEELSTFFADKVKRVQAATSGSPPPAFRPAPPGISFAEFEPLSPDDVAAAVARLPDKSSAVDPIPVTVLKNVADLLTPFLTHLFNRSLATGCVPACFKDSFVTPILKKSGLDEASPSSYRPISNLTVISKLLERLVSRQLVAYLETNHLLPTTQSGYRRGHSTETATIRVLSDLLDAVDRGDTAALVLLDLTAAFDTVDHEILLKRLRVTFGVDNSALAWFQSYLAGRKQHVRCGGKCSILIDIICGVPQGSVLGPILFIIYTADLASIVAQHGLSLHQYADDSQIYGSCQSDATSTLSSDITECVDDMYRWMRSNRLQLNGEKTEVMWCSSTRRLPQLPNSSIVVAGTNVQPVRTVRDLGVYIDSDLGAATHVRKTVSCCFAALRQLRHLRRYVTDDCFRSLVVSLIHSRLDYGNFVLVGLPAYLQRQLQSVLNAAARLVFRLRRYDHITDALAILHWLRVPQRVDFKIAVMAFRVLHGLAPPYLDQLVRVADLPGRRTRSLRSSTSLQLDIPAYRLESIGRRSFPVAASTLWNTLPSEIQSSPSLTLFRQRLKTYLFQKSFPDVLL